MAANTRAESDAFGEIQVAADRYWGAQTERSLENFRINQPQDRMPPPIVRAFGILKGAAATVNMRYGLGEWHPISAASVYCEKRRKRSSKTNPAISL
jgi:fumarate hydratase, class II